MRLAPSGTPFLQKEGISAQDQTWASSLLDGLRWMPTRGAWTVLIGFAGVKDLISKFRRMRAISTCFFSLVGRLELEMELLVSLAV